MIILSKSLHDYLKAAAIKDGKRVLLFPQIRHSQRTKKAPIYGAFLCVNKAYLRSRTFRLIFIGSESNMKYYLQDIDTGIILRI